MSDFVFNKSDIVGYYAGELSGRINPANGIVRIGYVNGKNLVVALPFKTGNSYASAFSFNITLAYNINNPSVTAAGSKFAFAITEANDLYYKNHNGEGDGINYNGAGDGHIIFTPNNFATNYYDLSGSVEKSLKPNTDYILWLFPNYKGMQISADLKYNYASQYTYKLVGTDGCIQIDVGDKIINAIPYIDNGTELKQAIPYIDNGASLEVCR